MDHLPLTRSAPWDEMPPNAGMEPLFAELAPLREQPVEVVVTAPGRQYVMDIVVAEADVARAFMTAYRECAGLDGFKIIVQQFTG